MKAKSDTTMQILTLHDAIQKVLVDTKVPMTTRELADYINDKSLYLRKDGNLVTASQVMSRIGNYPDMFSKKGRKVSLKGFNKIDLADEQIKSNLSHFMNQLYRGYSFRQSSVLPLILRSVIEIENRKGSFGNVNDFLNSVFNDIEFSSDFDLNRGNLLPDFLTVIFNIYKHPKRNHILQKVLYWLNEKERINEFSLMPEYLCSIIGKLDYFGGHINIFSTANMLSNYVLDIFDNNPESNFKHTYSTLWENPQIQKLNAFVLFASSAQHSDSELPIKHIGVLTPPWGFRSSESRWSSNFEHLMQQGIEENKPNLNRAILIVPEGASFNKGKDFAARKILTDSKYLESVTTIPYKSTSTGLGSVEIMTFNFERQIDHVLLADFTKVENFDIEMDWERVANVINTRVAERDVSTFATFEAIESNEYIWSPKKYLIAPEVIQIKENHTLYRLEDLLLSWKRGKKFDRKKLYKGGEVKYLRTSELNVYGELDLNDSILGIDHDELDFEPVSVKNSIVVSMVGNHLKNTLLPDNTPFLIDNNLSLLEVNTSKVLPEFLNLELCKPYVQQQLDAFRVGTAMPRLQSKELLSLEIQVPSLSDQKDILLSRKKDSEIIFIEPKHYSSSSNREDSNVILHNYLGIIKHTMMQPLATLEADIDNIDKYIKRKVEEGQLNESDFIFDLLAGEKEEDNEASRVTNTLNRLSRAINEAQWRFTQSEKLLRIETSEINRQKVNIKEVLEDQIKAYSGIDFKIKGKRADVMLDAKIWSILIDNLVDNANKHGFIDQEKKKILFDISIVQNNEGVKEVVISYFNNGLPLPSNFNLEKFISNGVTSDKSAGDGFGGYLIHSILKKHDGRIEVLPSKELVMDEYNVCFKIYLKEY